MYVGGGSSVDGALYLAYLFFRDYIFKRSRLKKVDFLEIPKVFRQLSALFLRLWPWIN